MICIDTINSPIIIYWSNSNNYTIVIIGIMVIITLIYGYVISILYILVGGIPTPLKNMKVIWDYEIPNWMEKTVPNHQPGIVFNNINTKYLKKNKLFNNIIYIYYLGKLLVLWYFTNLNCCALWGWFPLLTMIPARENSEVVIIYPDTVLYIYIHIYIYINIHHLYILLRYILISIRWNRHQAWTDDHPC